MCSSTIPDSSCVSVLPKMPVVVLMEVKPVSDQLVSPTEEVTPHEKKKISSNSIRLTESLVTVTGVQGWRVITTTVQKSLWSVPLQCNKHTGPVVCVFVACRVTVIRGCPTVMER